MPYRITVVDEPRVAVVDQVQPLPTPRLVADGDTSSSSTAAVIGLSPPIDTSYSTDTLVERSAETATVGDDR